MSNYSNGLCARTRFRQIKKRLGYTDDGPAPATPFPSTPRSKKGKVVGSGTNGSASKVTKKRSPAKARGAKAKSDPHEEPAKDDEEEHIVKNEPFDSNPMQSGHMYHGPEDDQEDDLEENYYDVDSEI